MAQRVERPRGAYVGSNETSLRVISTTSWTLTNEILWDDPATSVPDGANQAIIEAALARTMSSAAGAWGLHFITVDYAFTATDEQIASLPAGNYGLVIRYTATTDSFTLRRRRTTLALRRRPFRRVRF